MLTLFLRIVEVTVNIVNNVVISYWFFHSIHCLLKFVFHDILYPISVELDLFYTHVMLHIHELVIVNWIDFCSKSLVDFFRVTWSKNLEHSICGTRTLERNKNFPRKNTRKNCCLPQYSVSVTAKQAVVKLLKITKNYYFYLK